MKSLILLLLSLQICHALDPTTISGLIGWWNADDISILGDGTAVATWPDGSGSNNHLIQSTGTKQPTLKTSIINGHAVVRFDGTTDGLISTNDVDLTATKAVTFFVVCKSGIGHNKFILEHTTNYFTLNSFALAQGTNGFGDNVMIIGDHGAGSVRSEWDTQRRDHHTEFAVWSGMIDRTLVPFQNSISFSEIWMRVDGASAGGSTAIDAFHGNQTNFYPVGKLHMGAQNASTFFYPGDIAEALLWNRRLTTTEQASVDRWLMTKYDRYSGVNGLIVFDGDSHTAGQTTTFPYPEQCMLLLTNKYHWGNWGLGAQGTADWHTNTPYPPIDATLYYPSNRVMIYWLGANDLKFSRGTNVAINGMSNQCLYARNTLHYKVCLVDMLPIDASFPSLPADFESNRLVCNAWIASHTNVADSVYKVSQEPNLTDPNNATYYGPDKGHLTIAGYGVVAAGVAAKLREFGLDAYIPSDVTGQYRTRRSPIGSMRRR